MSSDSDRIADLIAATEARRAANAAMRKELQERREHGLKARHRAKWVTGWVTGHRRR